MCLFLLLSVGSAQEPSGVARCCHSDLLLPVGGFWRSHLLLQLQPREVCLKPSPDSQHHSLPLCPFDRKQKPLLTISHALRNNCERDALTVGIINSATSLYASISVFSILGFKAKSNFNTCLNECVCAKHFFCSSHHSVSFFSQPVSHPGLFDCVSSAATS